MALAVVLFAVVAGIALLSVRRDDSNRPSGSGIAATCSPPPAVLRSGFPPTLPLTPLPALVSVVELPVPLETIDRRNIDFRAAGDALNTAIAKRQAQRPGC